jgi:hypothetical protein
VKTRFFSHLEKHSHNHPKTAGTRGRAALHAKADSEVTDDKLVSPESVEGVIIVDARVAVSPQRVSIDTRSIPAATH